MVYTNAVLRKDNIWPVTSWKHRRKKTYSSTFLPSALDGGKWYMSCHGRINPVKNGGTQSTGSWKGTNCSRLWGDVHKMRGDFLTSSENIFSTRTILHEVNNFPLSCAFVPLMHFPCSTSLCVHKTILLRYTLSATAQMQVLPSRLPH
jgi:hypothetical protein